MTIVTATEKSRMINLPLVTATAAVAAAADTVILPSPGGIIVNIQRRSNATVGSKAEYGWAYNTGQVNGTIAASTTALVYASATASTRPAGDFFIQNMATGEICYVTADSGYAGTSGTMTVIRGALGTTAAPFTESHFIQFMNSIYFIGGAAGVADMVYFALPYDPKAKVF